MIDAVAQLIINEGVWLPVAMSIALAATGWLYFRHRRRAAPRPLVTAAMHQFVGVTLAIMGIGHLLAVTTKFVQGTLDGSLWLLYPIGIAVLVPSVLLVRQTPLLLANTDQRKVTVALDAWLAATLVVLGLVNIPLAIPVLLNLGYRIHVRRSAGLAMVGAAVFIQAGLLIGGLIFMASGQNFEQFSGIE